MSSFWPQSRAASAISCADLPAIARVRSKPNRSPRCSSPPPRRPTPAGMVLRVPFATPNARCRLRPERQTHLDLYFPPHRIRTQVARIRHGRGPSGSNRVQQQVTNPPPVRPRTNCRAPGEVLAHLKSGAAHRASSPTRERRPVRSTISSFAHRTRRGEQPNNDQPRHKFLPHRWKRAYGSSPP